MKQCIILTKKDNPYFNYLYYSPLSTSITGTTKAVSTNPSKIHIPIENISYLEENGNNSIIYFKYGNKCEHIEESVHQIKKMISDMEFGDKIDKELEK